MPRTATVTTRVPEAPNDREFTPPPGPSSRSVLSKLGSVDRDASDPDLRYAIQREIDRGGMGRVLEVEDTDLNRRVAMKVLLPDERRASRFRRFIAEAQVTAQLDHPGILPVHDFGVNQEGEIFFTMKLVEGNENLEQIIERLRAGDAATHARYTFERRVQLIQRVCQSLSYAHARGVVHRDLKPANIMIGPFGEVFIVDWGLAKVVEEGLSLAVEEDPPARTESGRLTTAGKIVGTLAYMPPEQARGEAADTLNDIFSLVAVLYEFLSLEHYLGEALEGSVHMLNAALQGMPHTDAEDHVQPIAGRVPRFLSRVCRKGLQRERELRFQTAGDLEEALQAWKEGCSPIVCPGTAIQRTLSVYSNAIDRRPVLMPLLTIVTAAAMLASSALGLWYAASLVGGAG